MTHFHCDSGASVVVITARFCFWRSQSVVFCLCMKYLGNRLTDLRQIHTEDVFGPLLEDEFEGQGHQEQKAAFFGPFGGLHAVYVW